MPKGGAGWIKAFVRESWETQWYKRRDSGREDAGGEAPRSRNREERRLIDNEREESERGCGLMTRPKWVIEL